MQFSFGETQNTFPEYPTQQLVQNIGHKFYSGSSGVVRILHCGGYSHFQCVVSTWHTYPLLYTRIAHNMGTKY